MAAPLIHCYETAGTASTSITVNKPGSGSSAGPDGAKNPAAGFEYLLVVVACEVANPGTTFFTEAQRPDSSWTFLGNVSHNTPDCAVGAWLHKVTGSEGSNFTFGTWAANDCTAICVLLGDVAGNIVTAIHQVDSGGYGSTPFDITGVTTTLDDCVAFAVCAFDGGDDGGYSTSGTGWTELAEFRSGTGSGNSSGCISYRKMSGNGSTGTCTITTSVSDGLVGFQFAIAPIQVSIDSVTPSDFRMDELSIDVAGSGFEASQGGGTVYLSDADTLAGSANEVDISSAVNTWADGNINLDLTQLSAGELASLHTLGPGTRYVIVLTDGAIELGSPAVALHRPVAFTLSLSDYIPASGEDATAQLTAPSGKTTGNFGGGRRSDDENPGDTVDLATDEYREDEWCVEATTDAIDAADYEFRVLYDGAVAVTISVTPGVTIGAATVLTPSPVTAAFGVATPVVTKGTVTLVPSAVAAAFSVVAPTITNVLTLAVDAVTAAFSVAAPVLTLGTVTLTPDPVTAAFSVPAPVVTAGAVTLTPDPVVAAFSIAAPTVTAGAVEMTPDPVTAAWSTAAPTLALNMLPGAASAAFSVVAPVVTNDVTLTPSAVTAAFGVATPVLGLGTVTLTPSPVAAAFGIATPSLVLGTVTLTPSPVAAAWSVTAPTVTNFVTIAPLPVSAQFGVDASLIPTVGEFWDNSLPGVSTPDGTKVSYSRDTTISYHAPYALKVERTVGAGDANSSTVYLKTAAGTNFSVTGGKSYGFRARCNGYAYGGKNVSFYIQFLNGGTPVGSVGVSTSTDATWKLLATVGAAPATADNAYAFFYIWGSQDAGYVHLDSVEVYENELLTIGGITLTPDPVTAAWSVPTPTLDVGAEPQEVTPSPVTAAFSVATPSLTLTYTATPSPVAAAFGVATPTVTPGPITLTPSPVTAAFGVATPALTLGTVTLTPSPVTAAFGVATPGITLGTVTLTPSPVVAVWSVTTPTITGDRTLVPDAVTAAWSVAAPAVSSVYPLAPSPVTAAWSVATPTVTSLYTAAPSPVVATFSIPTPTVENSSAPQEATPSPVTAAFSVPAPTLTLTYTVAPSPATGAWSVAAPTVLEGPVELTPSAAVGAWSVPAPTVLTGPVTLTPSPTAGTWSVGTPAVLEGPITLTPDAVGTPTWASTTPALTLGGTELTPDATTGTWSIGTPAVQAPVIAAPSPVVAVWGIAAPRVSGAGGTIVQRLLRNFGIVHRMIRGR